LEAVKSFVLNLGSIHKIASFRTVAKPGNSTDSWGIVSLRMQTYKTLLKVKSFLDKFF
jgi:hypothetical protein